MRQFDFDDTLDFCEGCGHPTEAKYLRFGLCRKCFKENGGYVHKPSWEDK